MSKAFALSVIALLLSATLTTQAARHQPVDTPKGSGEIEIPEKVEEGCDGIGEEECLMRRTLTAHTDYIYTQNHKP